MTVTDRDIEIEAERIADETPLTRIEGAVLAADRNGLDDERICRLLGQTMTAVEKARRRLRKKRRDANSLLAELGDWAG
jgi:chromosome segregation and condensation protein ScpB